MTSPAPFLPRPTAATILMASVITIAVHCSDVTTDANRSRRDVVDPYRPLSLYTKPMNLPIPPCYEVDIPEQEGKFFGGRMTTVYQTIIVKETVRPVCLLVDGNVPSCDQVIHNNNHLPKNPAKDTMDGRRPAAVVDYQLYFIEPSRPNVKIEITEIPFRGVFQLTDANVELQGDEGVTEPVAEHPFETPPLQDVRPVMEVVQDSNAGGGQRQFLQGVLGTATTALNGVVANVGGLAGGLVTNVAGLAGGLVPNVAGLAGVTGNGAAGSVSNAAGGNQKQVTMFVTRVDKVVDDRVTATLAPKNCMPDFGQLDALRPCAIDPYEQYYQQLYLRPPKLPYQQQQLPPQLPQYQQPPQPPQYQQPPQPPQYQQPPQPPQPPPYPQHTQPSAVAVDIVSKVNGLVKDFVNAQTSRHGPQLYQTPFVDGTF